MEIKMPALADKVFCDKTNQNLIAMLKIIKERKQTPLNKNICYCEKHHIIPSSYFRHNNLTVDNTDENIVLLSAKEHMLVHWYLFKYYLETDKDNKMYFAMLNAIHKMTNLNSQQLKQIDHIDSEIFTIYESTKKHWSDYYKSIPGCHLGKMQIRDKNGKVLYIEKIKLDEYLENGYMTNMQYGFKQWNQIFQCWKTIGFYNTKAAYELVTKTFNQQNFTIYTMMSAFRKYIPEYWIIRNKYLQDKKENKEKYRINKYHKQHKKYTKEELEYVNTHTIQESIVFLNITYNAVIHIRSRLNKKRSHKYEKRIN